MKNKSFWKFWDPHFTPPSATLLFPLLCFIRKYAFKSQTETPRLTYLLQLLPFVKFKRRVWGCSIQIIFYFYRLCITISGWHLVASLPMKELLSKLDNILRSYYNLIKMAFLFLAILFKISSWLSYFFRVIVFLFKKLQQDFDCMVGVCLDRDMYCFSNALLSDFMWLLSPLPSYAKSNRHSC